MNRPTRLTTITPVTSPATTERSVAQYLADWLWSKQSLRPSTHAAYEIHVRRYLTPHLGALPLRELREIHIEQMYRHLASTHPTAAADQSAPTIGPGSGDDDGQHGLSISNLHRVHATLMSALNGAVRRGLLDRNPAATVELPRRAHARVSAWTEDELARFLHLTRHDRLHPLFLLLGLVGLRRGEAVALRWDDVDLNTGTLRVEQAAVRVAGQIHVGPPKSPSSLRSVALDEETARRLGWHAARQRLEILNTTGNDQRPVLVFTTAEGNPLDPAYVSRSFARLLTRHGIRRIRLHDLRHTSASLGIAAGETLVEVSRRLGHSSITVTADIYSHVSPAVARESAQRLAAHVYR